MKKLVLFVAAALVSMQAINAQSKGEMYVSGSITLTAGSTSTKVTLDGNASKQKGSVPTTFSISPAFGYFVADKFRIGASIGVALQTAKAEGIRNTVTTFLAGPEVAYYIPLVGDLYLTPELGLYGGTAKYSEKEGSTTNSTNFGTFAAALNLVQFEYRASDRLGVAIGLINLSYTTSSKKIEKVKTAINTFSFSFSPSLSVRYYF